MATTTPTPASPWRILKLLTLAVFAPSRFDEEERKDNKILIADTRHEEITIRHVTASYRNALVLGTSAVVFGFVSAELVMLVMQPAELAVAVSGVVGTAVLLWATLALKGWEIQSYGGVSLKERVNRWLFRSLYWLGTVLIVVAAVWSLARSA